MILCSTLGLVDYYCPEVDQEALLAAEHGMAGRRAVTLNEVSVVLGSALRIKLSFVEDSLRRILASSESGANGDDSDDSQDCRASRSDSFLSAN